MRPTGVEVPRAADPRRPLAAWRLTGGDPAAPTVIAIHGITATSRSWLAVAAALGDRVSLVAPDLRGRAASRPVGPPYGLDVHADDVLALLDHLELDRPVIAGHSLGAYVACRFATRHPDRVARLVLVDGGLALPGLAAVPRADAEAAVVASLGPAVARLRTDFPDRAAYRRWWAEHPAFAGSDVDPEVLGAVADYDLAGDPPRLRPSIDPDVVPVDGVDLIGVTDADRLPCPAVLCHAPLGLDGAPPPLLAPEIVAAWAAGDPDRRRVVELDGANHYTVAMGAAGAAVVAAEILAAVDPASA